MMMLMLMPMLAVLGEAAGAPEPVAVILDTDIGPDCDDAGALAVLNALEDLGEARLLAVACCTSSEWGPGCIAAINTYWGRPEILLGTFKGEGFLTDSPYSRQVAEEFPHPPAARAEVEDARLMYRRVLEAQPDHSVVVCAIGPMNNLRDLLDTPADSISPRTGEELVAQKVLRLVDMGGEFPDGKEWNVEMDVPAARAVAERWPTPVIYSGFSIGNAILTGPRLYEETPVGNPVRRAYDLYTNHGNRMSWDQTAALCAVRGWEPYWDVVPGRCEVLDDGTTRWHNARGLERLHLVVKMPPEEVGRVIEDLMVMTPQARLREQAEGGHQ